MKHFISRQDRWGKLCIRFEIFYRVTKDEFFFKLPIINYYSRVLKVNKEVSLYTRASIIARNRFTLLIFNPIILLLSIFHEPRYTTRYRPSRSVFPTLVTLIELQKKRKKKIGKIKLRMSTIFSFYFGFYCVAQKAKYYEIKITIWRINNTWLFL